MMQMPPTQSQYFPLLGGLDVESAQLSRKPGLLMAGTNYESASENGYERIGGFERLDGRPRPSDAVFVVLQASVAFTGVASGTTVNGQTTGATAKVIGLRGANQLITTKQTGAFAFGENIRVGTTAVGVLATIGDNFNSAEENTFAALAAADYRADIGAVPGSGAVRGLEWLGSTCYAFRDNAAATALAVYKSSPAGWVLVPFLRELSFTAGSGAIPAEGATVTKGATTALVRRVVLQSGSFGAGSAAGRLIVDTVALGPFTAGAFTAGMVATVSAPDTAITMLPGGRLDTVVYNFTGSTDTRRLYGADGKNRGFEFDGTVLVPIATGMAADTPLHCSAHKNHLFFSFRASVQHSGIGSPYAWTAVLGAAELATGEDVTGFQSPPGSSRASALMIFSESRSLVLYGDSAATWQLTTFTPYVGAQRYSSQNIGSPVVLDAQGVSIVTQSQEFGDFNRSPVSMRIRRALAGLVVTASVVNRIKNRMRVFFSNGEALSITAVAGTLAFTTFNYGKTVSCTSSAMVSGVNRTFFGGTDGFVYEADVGRSFDGATIIAFAKLAFNIAKSPGVKKRFRWADVELKPQSACSLQIQGEYSLGDVDVGLSDVYIKTVRGTGGAYDLSSYDLSYYDTPTQSTLKVRLDGAGTSLSLTFYSEAANELPHELQSVNTFYSPRRLERG